MSTRITSDMWAVVPVKLLERTKRRLIPLLSSDERESLACAMLQDVLSALMRARSLAGLLVITGDAKAAAIAHAAGAVVLPDTENAGTTAAVTQAAQHLIRMGRSGMLVIPADLPSITSSDIDTIAAAHRSAPSVTLVRAIADGGTNALACSPPDAIPFCFGDDSLRRHRDAATRRAIEPQILKLESIGQDIDRPDDLAMFIARPSPTQTYACLVAHGIAERLKPETLSS
jgi:2-phospho-L-lactate guanylyltransferase